MAHLATGWVEMLLGGAVPDYVKAVPAPFRELLIGPYRPLLGARSGGWASTGPKLEASGPPEDGSYDVLEGCDPAGFLRLGQAEPPLSP